MEPVRCRIFVHRAGCTRRGKLDAARRLHGVMRCPDAYISTYKSFSINQASCVGHCAARGRAHTDVESGIGHHSRGKAGRAASESNPCDHPIVADTEPNARPKKEKPRKSENLRGLFRHCWRRRRDSNPRSRFWPRCSLSRGVPSTSRPRLPNFRSHQGGSATRTR